MFLLSQKVGCSQELYDRISEKYTCSLEFVPPGEKCKYFPILEQTCEKLIAKGASKKTILIAFGGGTVGNVVGLTCHACGDFDKAQPAVN